LQANYKKQFLSLTQLIKHLAQLVKKILDSSKNYLITRLILSFDIIAGREMAGCTMTSMPCAITKDLLLPCSKSKMVIALADLQTPCGHHQMKKISGNYQKKKISHQKMRGRVTLALSSLI